MDGFSQCTNGHYFKNTLGECPYCPRSNSANKITNAFDKTQISNNEKDFTNTQVSGSGDFGSTQVFGAGTSNTAKRDFSKTFIQDNESSDDGVISINTLRPCRKIMGWIVSYSYEPMGLDFKIFEGVNSIGRDAENTITITDDMGISGKHLSILCKKEKFYIKDEMAANGTFVNNAELEIGKTYDLNDGDEIKLGTTIFKFRTSF